MQNMYTKQKSNVGPLHNNGCLTNGPSEMEGILQNQYKSVLSNPAAPEKKHPTTDDSHLKASLSYIDFSQEDIEVAIDEIERDAPTTDNDIPASVLKEYKSFSSYLI